MHHYLLALTGAMGLFIGLDVLVRIPSLWGYPALAGGFTLLSISIIRDYDHA